MSLVQVRGERVKGDRTLVRKRVVTIGGAGCSSVFGVVCLCVCECVCACRCQPEVTTQLSRYLGNYCLISLVPTNQTADLWLGSTGARGDCACWG